MNTTHDDLLASQTHSTRQCAWTVNHGEASGNTEYIAEGDIHILDEQADNMTARRVRHTLEDSVSNNLAQILEGLSMKRSSPVNWSSALPTTQRFRRLVGESGKRG